MVRVRFSDRNGREVSAAEAMAHEQHHGAEMVQVGRG